MFDRLSSLAPHNYVLLYGLFHLWRDMPSRICIAFGSVSQTSPLMVYPTYVVYERAIERILEFAMRTTMILDHCQLLLPFLFKVEQAWILLTTDTVRIADIMGKKVVSFYGLALTSLRPEISRRKMDCYFCACLSLRTDLENDWAFPL